MENFESGSEKTRLEELQGAINKAPNRIEEEFARTENSWLACFGSSVFVVETYLTNPKLEALISPEKYTRAVQRMEELKKELQELKQQYPEKDTIPSTEIQHDLLEKLNVLSEGQ